MKANNLLPNIFCKCKVFDHLSNNGCIDVKQIFFFPGIKYLMNIHFQMFKMD